MSGELAGLHRSMQQQVRAHVQSILNSMQTPNAAQQAQAATALELHEARTEIKELEHQVDLLRKEVDTKGRQMELLSQQGASSQAGASGQQGEKGKSDRWKLLDVQREKVAIRKELLECRESVAAASRVESELRTQTQMLEHERSRAVTELQSLRDSHEQHTNELEEKIQELTQAVMLLRRKGSLPLLYPVQLPKYLTSLPEI